MLDELNEFLNLAKFEVALTGSWGSSPSEQWEWRGEAIAEIPIVSIIFLGCGNRMYWAKSGMPYARIAPQVYESRPISNSLPLVLRIHPTLNLHVQFMYSFGLLDGIYHATAMLGSKDYLPPIPQSRTVYTGQLFQFANFDSTPIVTLYTMFLAKQDVKVRRKHIWGLRKPLLTTLPTLPSPLHDVFAVGRNGEFA